MITPFYLGWIAFEQRVNLADSPYKYCTQADDQWIEGWWASVGFKHRGLHHAG